MIVRAEDHHLGPLGISAREPECVDVGAARGQGELPLRQAEAVAKQPRYVEGFLGGEQEVIALSRLGATAWSIAFRSEPGRHGEVREIEVAVDVSVEVGELRGFAAHRHDGGVAPEASHPRHGHAVGHHVGCSPQPFSRTGSALGEGGGPVSRTSPGERAGRRRSSSSSADPATGLRQAVCEDQPGRNPAQDLIEGARSWLSRCWQR